MSADDKDFSLALDDDVLAAALASVDKHLGGARKRRAYDLLEDPEKEAARTQAEMEKHGIKAGAGVELLDEDLELDVELSVDLDLDESDVLAEEPADAPSNDVETAAAADDDTLRLADRNQELEALTSRQAAEIKMLRDAAAKQQADLKEQKERAVRLNVRGKRLHQQHESLKLKMEDAQAKLDEWETQLHELREAVRVNERDRGQRLARHQKETEEARFTAKEKTLRELLPVVDNLELAMAHADETPSDQMVEGIRMILRQLDGAFDRLGLLRIDSSPGAAFNPTVHEAIKHVPSENAEPNTVLTTHQVGWRLHDRLLRAARVEVAAAPLDEMSVDANQEAEQADGAASAEE